MGIIKRNLHDDEINSLADSFRALGHPARIAILQNLIKRKSCVCGDLVLDIGLSQPTISQHLKVLKDNGIITGKIEGNNICYYISLKRWKGLKTLVRNFLDSPIADQNECC